MELIFIRHLKTKGNRLRQYIGVTDEPLDQPVLLREYPNADTVVVSPLKRCIQTAELIYPGKGQMICPGLRECDFGEFEKKTYEELKNHPAYQKWLDSGGAAAFPGGEGREAFVKRSVAAFEEAVRKLMENGCRRASFVVHGGTIMAVLSEFDREKRDFYQWQVANGEGFLAKLDETDWKSGKKQLTEIRKI
ncbi:histidine phosphatase family protein [Sporofaciens sp. SGI.106]|uniref:histidine phosphatase family protein n=1 Tax=Sporofaciens sp. SGI.106 TaxID=3420568 RepID=UPI002A9CB68D|nr:histidine phosphatase family protein [Lachnoclostridium sp.]